MVETSRPIPPETGHLRRKKLSEGPKEKVRQLRIKLKEIADRKPSAEVQEALAALKEPSETERALADVRAAIAEKKAEDEEGRAISAEFITPKKAEIVSGEIDTERAAKKKHAESVLGLISVEIKQKMAENLEAHENVEGWPAQKRTEVQELGKKVRRKSDEFMAQSEAQVVFKQALVDYAEAYKKFDPKFTKNKPNALIALTRPPFLAFSAQAKELKLLYKALNIARKNAEREDDEEKIKQNLAVARTKPITNKGALPAEARAALAKSAQAEEEAIGVKTLSDESAWYQSEGEDGANSELVRQAKKEMRFEPVPRADYLKPQPEKAKMPKTRAELSEGIRSSEKVVDYLGGVIEQQATGKKKRIDEISKYFMRKNKMSAEPVHKFLMGEEIKGLFNGSQRKMQREYQSLYNSPVYKEWLKLKGK